MEYLFGHESNPAEFRSAAEQLCGEGYTLVGGGLSQDFHDWTTFEFRLENGSNLPSVFDRYLRQLLPSSCPTMAQPLISLRRCRARPPAGFPGGEDRGSESITGG